MGLISSIKIAMVLTVIGTAGLGYAYVKRLQSNLETARANVIRMELAVKTSEESLDRLRVETKRFNELNSQLQADLQKAERYGDELRNTLQKHNLTVLAEKKPGLIEKRINDATDKLWDDLFDVTDPNRVLGTAIEGTTDSNSN
jgi:hypothetical protein